MRSICLSIAGFDPSGGAGVIADCKTFEQLRVTGLSVITANTFQTDSKFDGLIWISKNQIIRQLRLLLNSYQVRSVKIGLIENGDVLLDVLQLIQTLAPEAYIIWDPVIRASADVSDEINLSRFREKLPEILNHIDLITPNVPEKQILFGDNDLLKMSKEFKTAILLKGGHAEKKGKDFLFLSGECFGLNPKISGDFEKHGSGCVLSSAIASHLAKNYPFKKAIFLSKRYVERFLTSQKGLIGNHSR